MSSFSAFAILGPTASGKTALALALSQYFPCEIISLDSALVYQNMDIGTAKPTPEERQRVPHHLIDIIAPTDHYSAADFAQAAQQKIHEIRARGRMALIVGGTMMYFHALTHGLNALPSADADMRARLQDEKRQFGLAHLYQRLQNIDPETAARLDPNDAQRIERALEVFELTGKKMSTYFQAATNTETLPIYTLALIPQNRAPLHALINQRFAHMLAQGLLDEVIELQKKYPNLTPEMPAMRCVGYRQAWAYLAGEIDRTELLAQGQAATRQLAKRQLTWLRKTPTHAIIDPFSTDPLQAALNALAHSGLGNDLQAA